MITLKSYLEGRWQEGKGKGASLVNPTTGDEVAQASAEGLDLKSALAYARERGGASLRALTFAERGEILQKLASAIHEAREPLIAASILNGGTTRSDAKFDIDGGMATLAHYAELGKTLGDKRFLVDGEGEKVTRSARFYGYHVRVPRRGVAVHINAFNFPTWGMAEKLAASLLAGMPTLTKPATSTALLAYEVMVAWVNTGALPDGALSFLAGSAGDLLSHLGPFDVLAFTGGSSTAKTIRGHANVIAHNVRVNIEADSLNSTVLGADVEPGSDLWHTFVRHVVTEMTQKAGQKCTATRRIFVPRERADALEEALKEALSALKVGNPSSTGVNVGPLATKAQRDEAKAGIAKLQASGARIVAGEGAPVLVDADASKGFFVGPTLLRADDAANAAAVHAVEVFAPVSTLLPYTSAEEVVALAARGEGGLVSSLYTDDKAQVEHIALGLAALHGRVLVVSSKTADQTIAPGLVLPSCIHGGPGRAGGGEELGGLRGLDFYTQRTAIQGDRTVLGKMLGASESA
jgi:3,4-dehydroadipyl-CoA semialdehyde dehydrogenase